MNKKTNIEIKFDENLINEIKKAILGVLRKDISEIFFEHGFAIVNKEHFLHLVEFKEEIGLTKEKFENYQKHRKLLSKLAEIKYIVKDI